jgi:hypothetical protein
MKLTPPPSGRRPGAGTPCTHPKPSGPRHAAGIGEPEARAIAVAPTETLRRVADHPKYGCLNVNASLLPPIGAPRHPAADHGRLPEKGVPIMCAWERIDTGGMLLKHWRRFRR